jgi:hypothetical protein
MSWNTNLSQAPQDTFIWAASACGKVIKSHWDHKREQWSGFATSGAAPVAWQPFVVPAHPNAAALAAKPNLDDVHVPFLDDVGGSE